MKVLFLSDGSGQDYLRDCVAHGMRTILGPDFVDAGKLSSLYIGADKSQMYGRGFTLYGLLPDIPVDRTDIPKKIRDKYFDIIVYGSIHRNQNYLHESTTKYRPPNLIALDGEDHTGYLSGIPILTFKRELYNPQPGCLPIQFGIPAEKVLPSPPQKTKLMAPMDPLHKHTYTYKTEAEYYAQYASACYAPTMKKAGWDCLRHYEILSQWCLPYFRVFDQCPPTICEKLPRREMNIIRMCIEHEWKDHSFLEGLYEHLIEPFMKIVRQDLTTTALATYILDSVGVSTKETVCS